MKGRGLEVVTVRTFPFALALASAGTTDSRRGDLLAGSTIQLRLSAAVCAVNGVPSAQVMASFRV
jgi:hypothetical protein